MRDHISDWGRRSLGPALGVVLVSYFAFHTVSGDRGLLAYLKLRQTLEVAQVELAETQAVRDKLAHEVALLTPGSLDADMLEERARLVLNVGHATDWIIPDPLVLNQ